MCMHAPGRGAPASRMGRPVIVRSCSTPQDCVGRPWSVGYGPQGRPRSPAGAKLPGATCGPRTSALLPGLKVEREAMLMVGGDVGSELLCFRHTVSGTGLRAGSHPLPEPPSGNLQHPLVPSSGVSLEPGRHPISGRSQPRVGSLQAALGCG